MSQENSVSFIDFDKRLEAEQKKPYKKNTSTPFRLIKGREEHDLSPELFNHVDGREVLAFNASEGFLISCYCRSRTGHIWRE